MFVKVMSEVQIGTCLFFPVYLEVLNHISLLTTLFITIIGPLLELECGHSLFSSGRLVAETMTMICLHNSISYYTVGSIKAIRTTHQHA